MAIKLVTLKDNSGETILYPATQMDQIVDKEKYLFRLPPGSFLWWTGFIEDRPSYTLLCDGSLLNKADYPDLFKVIGYIYGGSGSTFKLPDLFTSKTGEASGQFIRAGWCNKQTTKDSPGYLGQKQIDEIRNIYGYFSPRGDKDSLLSAPYNSGAITVNTTSDNFQKVQAASEWATGSVDSISFDANLDSSSNPMAGHANGTDIHPQNIRFNPLIFF